MLDDRAGCFIKFTDQPRRGIQIQVVVERELFAVQLFSSDDPSRF